MMLVLQKFGVFLGEKTIVQPLNITFPKQSISVILGQNGSGKTSLALSIMGHPHYQTKGKLLFDGEDITNESPTERAERGLFLSFQNILEIPGIPVLEYLRTIYESYFSRQFPDKKVPSPFVFTRMVEKLLPEYDLGEDFLARELFVGFSGGEKRRLELLQVALLEPQCIILDEVDSGLDVDALHLLQHHIGKWKEQGKTIILISHNMSLIQGLPLDTVVVMDKGRIRECGGPTLIKEISQKGFNGLTS